MKMSRCSHFMEIVTNEIPLIDVRAPIEFEKGAFKHAVNLPIMDDEERAMVGIRYKEKGSEEAVKLGHKLVSGDIREERIHAWANHLEEYPSSRIYCFRGGLRSQIAQQWIADVTGRDVSRLEGGYKAFRNYLITKLDPSQQQSKPVLVGGFTGSGKTTILNKLVNAIDLEGIANHRGSSFGKQITPQPTQINFENDLAYALIQHKSKGYQYMILEDEGKNIGRSFIPKPLVQYFGSGDFVLVTVPMEERVTITMAEYVHQSQSIYMEVFTEEKGLMEWAKYIRTSLKKISKRLGGERYQSVLDMFEQAYQKQIDSGSCVLHRNWVETLLGKYYDPMYQYKMDKISDRIVFEGYPAEVLAYLESEYSES